MWTQTTMCMCWMLWRKRRWTSNIQPNPSLHHKELPYSEMKLVASLTALPPPRGKALGAQAQSSLQDVIPRVCDQPAMGRITPKRCAHFLVVLLSR